MPHLNQLIGNLMTADLYNKLHVKLRMEMGNVSQRQQPDHGADNSRRPPIGLQCSEKLPHPEASFSWPQNKYAH